MEGTDEEKQKLGQLREILGVGNNDAPTSEEIAQALMVILHIIAGVRDDTAADADKAMLAAAAARGLVRDLQKRTSTSLKKLVSWRKLSTKKVAAVEAEIELLQEQYAQIGDTLQEFAAVLEQINDIPKEGPAGLAPAHQWRGTSIRFKRPNGSWGKWVDLQGVPGMGGGGGGGQGFPAPRAGAGISIRFDASGAPVITATGSGSTQTIEVPTGTVDDSNQDFVFTEKPFIIVVNGGTYRDTAGWSWSSPTATLDFPVGTGGDIFGIMQ